MCLVVLLVLAGATVGRTTGYLHPQLELGSWEISVDAPAHTFRLQFPIRNNDMIGERIVGVDSSAPGLSLVASILPRSTLRSDTSAQVTLTYAVRDCHTVSLASLPVDLQVQRFWGTLTSSHVIDASIIDQLCS